MVSNVHKIGVTDLDGVVSVLEREFNKLKPTNDRSMKLEMIAQVRNTPKGQRVRGS